MKAFRSFLIVGFVLSLGTLPIHSQEKKPLVYDSPFYPLQVGNQWRYKASVGDNPVQKVFISVVHQEAYDYKSTQDKKEVTETIVRFRLKIESGSKVLTEHVAVLKDGVYRFSTAGKEIVPPVRFLKLPLTKGESWTVDSLSENVPLKGTFVAEDAMVKVPAGQFLAKHVATLDFQLGADKMTLEYWFASDIGIVRQKVRVGNSDVLLELEEFKAGK